MLCSLPARIAGATGLLLAHSGISTASCVHSGSTPSQRFIFIDSRLTVSAADPVGKVIYDSGTLYATRMAYRCSTTHERRIGFTEPFTHIGEGIHHTNLAGVGIKITGSEAGASGYFSWPIINTRHPAGEIDITPSYRLQLIKTGPVNSGVLRFPQVIIRHSFEPHTPDNIARLTLPQTRVEVVSAEPTCDIDASSKNIPVNLGNHPQSFFTGVNKTTPERSFNIRLNCMGGSTGGSRNISYTITDAHFPGNQTLAVNLAPGAGAHGVGIRLLDRNDTAIRLGAARMAGTVDHGTTRYDIPLKAQYIQQVPASQIRPGAALGRALFTMDYH